MENSVPSSILTGQGNFNVRPEYRDFYSDVQRSMKRIGDKGAESSKFVERAYNQFLDHDFNELAKTQDSFIPSDPLYGSPGREKNRNYNRMEYDFNKRYDGKSKEDIMKEVNNKNELTVSKILNVLKKQGWTINTTASAVSAKPIQQKDYAGQEKY